MEKPTSEIALSPEAASFGEYLNELYRLTEEDLKIRIALYLKRSANAEHADNKRLTFAEEIFEHISKQLAPGISINDVDDHFISGPMILVHETIKKEIIRLINNILEEVFNATERSASDISRARVRANKILAKSAN